MKCERCHKNDVTDVIRVKRDGVLTDAFVCASCAAAAKGGRKGESHARKGRDPGLTPIADVMMGMASPGKLDPSDRKSLIRDLLGKIAKEIESGNLPRDGVLHLGEKGSLELDRDEKRKCPECGMTLAEFIENRKFGCAECFKAFGEESFALLRDTQISDNHVGVLPADMEQAGVIESLAEAKDKAILAQKFEDAAKLQKDLDEHRKQLEALRKKKRYRAR